MGTSDVHVALARVTKRLEELGIPYAICGGMALNAHGYKRATGDVDVRASTEGGRSAARHGTRTARTRREVMVVVARVHT